MAGTIGAWWIYARVSTEEQASGGVSLDVQQHACAAMLLARGIEAERVVVDAVSGKSLERPGMAQVLDAIDAGRLAGVAIWKLDRLTRSLRDLLDLVERLQAGGCELVSIQEAIDTSGPMGRFTLSLLGALAQLEREQISQRVSAAIQHLAAEGHWTGGPVPPGCRVVGPRGAKVLEADEQTSPIVSPIWQMVADGATLQQVCDYLTTSGVRPSRAAAWNRTGARGVLLRRDLIGVLVDRDTWEAAQRALGARWSPSKRRGSRMPSGRSDRVWPLAGIAKCGLCGCSLVGVRGGRGRAYLRCSGRVQHGRGYCDAKDLPADAYEAAAIEGLQQLVTDRGDDLVAAIASEAARLTAAVDADADDRRDLTLQRDRILERIDRLAEHIAEAVSPAAARAMQRRIGAEQEQADALEARLAELDGRAAAAAMARDSSDAYVDAIRAGIEQLHTADPATQRTILRGLVSRISITAGHAIEYDWCMSALTPPDAGRGDVGAGSYSSADWYTDLHWLRSRAFVRVGRVAHGRVVVAVVGLEVDVGGHGAAGEGSAGSAEAEVGLCCGAVRVCDDEGEGEGWGAERGEGGGAGGGGFGGAPALA